jgi:excisionase family DNA binding protein
MSEQSEWVSLGEAATILGVHPSTVRHWADNGDLPSQRTPGGHRRFLRRDLDLWASKYGQMQAPAEAQLMLQNALGRARIEIGGGGMQNMPWYAHLDEQARQTHRALGRRLLEILTQYLAAPGTEEGVLEDVRRLGLEYARLSCEQNLSLVDSVRAFLFFRDLLLDSVIQLAEMLSLHTPHDWADRIRQVNYMTDELLLALIESYGKPCEEV